MKSRAVLGVGIAALAACGGPRDAKSVTGRPDHATRAPRAIMFHAPGFPTLDAPAIDDKVLDEMPVDQARSVSDLGARLADADALVLPYGSAFPVDAWPQIRAFLRRGGGLLVLGGAPFRIPVRAEGATWTAAPPAPSFAHDLLLGPAEPIAHSDGARVTVPPGTSYDGPFPAPKTTWALTLRLATTKSFPDEHGSDGSRDGVARPLVHVVDTNGIARGCPLLEIERKGGARWILATSDASLDAGLVRTLVARVLDRRTTASVSPTRAVYEKTAPELRVTGTGLAKIDVKRDDGTSVYAAEIELPSVVKLPQVPSPGLHHVEVTQAGRPSARTGFWMRDVGLLGSGPKLEVSRDFLKKNGATFPIVGTTYMAPHAQRQFLFDPNPDTWDRDFSAMRKHDINFVRTGIWTAWSRVIPDGKNVDPGVLDALEAYVHTAAKHGIVVCFNLFAFLPPAFGGTHAFLDPRALAGQRAMLDGFARRFRGVSWIHWDLINEPSYAPPDKLWKTRPVRDDHEKRAWIAWVEKRHGKDLAKLRALWQSPEEDVLAVPRDEDLSQAFVQIDKRPRKARDFVLFTQEVVTEWARDMRKVLRDAAGSETLVTLGQDEGGIFTRPTQQLMADALDYTAVHTWWNNDDLLWDGVLTKVPEKPSLHQETGLMRLEDGDGSPWRTPAVAARLLERKIAYAFMARGAGVIEWAWNVNDTMPIDEESTIGLFRPDGTAKPELDALSDIGRFMKSVGENLADFDRDPVVLVIPHARASLGRTNAIDATKIVVRALAELFTVVPTAISDERLTAARLAGAKLVIVPAPDVLDEEAARAILDSQRAGSKVLVTGAIEGDSYGRATPSLRALGLLGPTRPVARHEPTAWSPSGSVAFEGMLQEALRRATRESRGKLEGDVWHEPLPLELAREHDAIAKLLRAALDAAHVPSTPGEWGVPARVLSTPQVALVVVVNEHPVPVKRRFVIDRSTYEVPVEALGARLALIRRNKEDVVAATAGPPITRRN